MTLRTHYILIKDGGVLHIGTEKCRYKSKATIALYGKSDEGESMPTFGKKFIGVEAGGTLELHGAQKASWTLLARTLNSSGLTYGSYAFEKGFFRGLNVRVIDQDTAKILESERFDTHEFHNESRRLQEFLRGQAPGRIVAIAVGDSAAKSLLQGTIQMIQDRLGSKLIQGLGYRWAYLLYFPSQLCVRVYVSVNGEQEWRKTQKTPQSDFRSEWPPPFGGLVASYIEAWDWRTGIWLQKLFS